MQCILVYIKFKGQIYYVLLLESKVQLHSTFRELFPLSTNHQIAPGVNGQGFNEEKIHISKYGLYKFTILADNAPLIKINFRRLILPFFFLHE
jgi:hypothetical protein